MTHADRLETLRIGIALDSNRYCEWHQRCVDALRALETVRLPLAVTLNGTTDDEDCLGSLPLTRFEPAPETQVTTIENVTRADLEQVDAVMSFTTPGIALPGREDLRFGVWSLKLGALDAATPPFIAELLSGSSLLEISLLQRRLPSQAARVLHRGSIRILPHDRAATLNLACTVGAAFAAKTCTDLLVDGDLPGFEVTSDCAPQYNLGLRDQLRYRMRSLQARWRDKMSYLFRHEQWGVGIIDQPVECLVSTSTCPDATWIPNEKRDRFIADPSGVIEPDGSVGVFVEDLTQHTYIGTVSYYRQEPDGAFVGPEPVLETNSHLSYPYIVVDQGTIYCIPESAQANEVAIYEITDYPGGWRKAATLLRDFAGLDSTVFQHDGRWWMFSTTRMASGAYSLVAFFADDLFGPWHPHAKNPLSTDIETSRPGGRPFQYDGKLIRPAQDCSQTYGGALALMAVDKLTPTDFQEHRVGVVAPNPNSPYPSGFHTAYAVGDKTLIDGKRFVFVPYLFLKAMRLAK